MSRLVLMGSGETAPAMVKTHRAVLAASGDGPALMLDTPYGFQVNADDLTRRTLKYFDESVGQEVVAASWRTRELGRPDAGPVLAEVSRASWLFAGPAVPPMRSTNGTTPRWSVPSAMCVDRGGSVVLGSAAAVTARFATSRCTRSTRSGPRRTGCPGSTCCNRFLGLSVAVIPHFDNAEGGTYDTRFCYLGEDRLRALEGSSCPREQPSWGSTSTLRSSSDITAGSVEVSGVGRLTMRRSG